LNSCKLSRILVGASRVLSKLLGHTKRLDCVHVVPGDARNKLVEEIVSSNLVSYGVAAIYGTDQSMRNRCSDLRIPFSSLGFKEKNVVKHFLSLYLFVLKIRPKSLFLHSFYPSLLGVGLTILCPFTKVVSVRHHNAVHLLSKNRKGAFVDNVIARATFRTVAVSHAVKATMVRQGCKPEKILVIHNGIRLEESIHKAVPQSLSHSKLKLIAVGRLDWQKNYETMLHVASALKGRNIDFVLSILGTGNQKYSESLFELSRILGLEDYVRWEGWQANTEKWLVESDILLHTAVDEACPLVLIEALLAGIPVVTSEAGGSSEVISGFTTGCRADDIEAYVDQILCIWENLTEFTLKAIDRIPLVEKRFGMIRMRNAYEISTLAMLGRN
jgi:glycosyltransferase involved in cell wall biosynthesis